jgi:hypothetical protein
VRAHEAARTPDPELGCRRRRTSGAATAAAARASPIASGARPTIRCGGRRPGDGWRSARSRVGWQRTTGSVLAGTGNRTPCGPEA